VTNRLSQITVRHAVFTLTVAGSTSGISHFRGHIRVRLHYGPVTRSHPEDGVVDGLQRFGFPLPCHPSYKALAFALAGLSPAERVRLLWTHNRTCGFARIRLKQTDYTFTFLLWWICWWQYR